MLRTTVCWRHCWKLFRPVLLRYYRVYDLCLLLFVALTAVMTVTFTDNSERYEPLIVDKFKAVPRTLGRFIVNGVRLLFLGQRNSMTALFVCENRTGLKNLVNVYAFGVLHSTLEELFTNLLATDDPEVTVHIKKVVWELSDYCRCYVYFNPLPKRTLIINGHIA